MMHDLMAFGPVDVVIAVLSLLFLYATFFEKLRAILILLQVLLMMLRWYKHIAPMIKYYFDTHPLGRQLKRKTTLDNKINYLIKTHQVPYDDVSRHEELEKKGAAG